MPHFGLPYTFATSTRRMRGLCLRALRLATIQSIVVTFGVGQAVANEGQYTEVQKLAFDGAIETCTSTLTDNAEVRARLASVGWVESVPNDAAGEALVYAQLFGNFRSDDLGYTFSNARFMAASILGNSSLGPDQPGFRFEDMVLGVFKVQEGNQYCVLTSKKQRFNRLFQSFDQKIAIGNKSDFVVQTLGYNNNFIFSMNALDIDAVTAKLATLPDVFTTENIEEFRTSVPATVFMIMSPNKPDAEAAE